MLSLHVASISALLSSIVTWKVTLESGMAHVEEANPQEQPLQPDQPLQPQDEISEEALPDETVPAPEPEPWLRLANLVMMVAPAEGEYAKLRWLLFGGEVIMLLVHIGHPCTRDEHSGCSMLYSPKATSAGTDGQSQSWRHFDFGH